MRTQKQKERDYTLYLKAMTLKELGIKVPSGKLERIINQQVNKAIQIIDKVQHQEVINQILEAVRKISASENGGSNAIY